MFSGRRDEQVHRAGRAMLSSLGERLLDLVRALPGAIAHGNPAEHRLEHAALLRPVGARPGRVEKLKLHQRAGCDDASRHLIHPHLAVLLLQDAEQARGVDEVERGAHRRYACLLPRNSSKSPWSAISPSLASALQTRQTLPDLAEGGVDGVLLRLGAEDFGRRAQRLFVDLDGGLYHSHRAPPAGLDARYPGYLAEASWVSRCARNLLDPLGRRRRATGHDIGGASRRQSLLRWLSFQGL